MAQNYGSALVFASWQADDAEPSGKVYPDHVSDDTHGPAAPARQAGQGTVVEAEPADPTAGDEGCGRARERGPERVAAAHPRSGDRELLGAQPEATPAAC